MIHTSFTDMSGRDRVEFFVQCQKLLVEFHPNSPFILREDNAYARIAQMKSILTQYKGVCYMNENLCMIYNKIVVSRADEPVEAIRAHMYKAPDPNYNAVIIDFVVFRHLQDCKDFVIQNYDPRIQYIVFVKNNKAKIYPLKDFAAQTFKIPVV